MPPLLYLQLQLIPYRLILRDLLLAAMLLKFYQIQHIKRGSESCFKLKTSSFGKKLFWRDSWNVGTSGLLCKYICRCVHKCMRECVYVYNAAYIRLRKYVFVPTCVFVRTHVWNLHTYMHGHMYVYYVYLHTYTYILTCVHGVVRT